jgi:2-methylcitrate dehydratase PrpD
VEDVLDIVVFLLRLVPMILAFYVPALIGTAIWRERDAGYRVQAFLWFVVGFSLVTFLHVLFTSSTASQVATILGLSVVQIVAALFLARLTVYRLAD